MRRTALGLALMLLAATAYAKEPKAYQIGDLLQMDSVSCGMHGKDSGTLAEEKESVSVGNQSRGLSCQEYVLQGEKTVYRIRPKNGKHAAILPVGEQARFRFDKDKMLVRVDQLDSLEREYVVVSITPRSDSTADAAPLRLNHLQ
jgi:hypothetical protein